MGGGLQLTVMPLRVSIFVALADRKLSLSETVDVLGFFYSIGLRPRSEAVRKYHWSGIEFTLVPWLGLRSKCGVGEENNLNAQPSSNIRSGPCYIQE